jgi:hypothetical protein
MDGFMSGGNVTSTKRPWPFGPESFEQPEHQFNPQPVAEDFQAPWGFNQVLDQSFFNPGDHCPFLDYTNQDNTFDQAVYDHVTVPTPFLSPILNQETREIQVPLEELREICFGSVFDA